MRTVDCMDAAAEAREFLTARRARFTPEAAGLPAYSAELGTASADALRILGTLHATTTAADTSTLAG